MPRTSKMSAKSLAKASDSVSSHRLRAVVGERNPLAQGAVAQIDRARDVDGVLEEHDPVVGVDVRVGEIDVELRLSSLIAEPSSSGCVPLISSSRCER